VPQVAFAPDVFTWPAEQPQLIGGRCKACGHFVLRAYLRWHACPATPYAIVDGTARKLELRKSKGRGVER